MQVKKGTRGSRSFRLVCSAIIDLIRHIVPSAHSPPRFLAPKRNLANPQASRLSFVHARASEQASYSTEPHPSHKCVLSRFCIPTLRRSELVLRRGQTHKGRGKSIVIVMSSIGFSYPDRTINWIQKKKIHQSCRSQVDPLHCAQRDQLKADACASPGSKQFIIPRPS